MLQRVAEPLPRTSLFALTAPARLPRAIEDRAHLVLRVGNAIDVEEVLGHESAIGCSAPLI